MLLDVTAELPCLALTAFSEGEIPLHARDLGEPHKYVIEEEREPDTFAFTFFTHHVHAVVPVTGTDERQAMFTK
jgi:hypothetical protein